MMCWNRGFARHSERGTLRLSTATSSQVARGKGRLVLDPSASLQHVAFPSLSLSRLLQAERDGLPRETVGPCIPCIGETNT